MLLVSGKNSADCQLGLESMEAECMEAECIMAAGGISPTGIPFYLVWAIFESGGIESRPTLISQG
jgi:hypothetical protein